MIGRKTGGRKIEPSDEQRECGTAKEALRNSKKKKIRIYSGQMDDR